MGQFCNSVGSSVEVQFNLSIAQSNASTPFLVPVIRTLDGSMCLETEKDRSGRLNFHTGWYVYNYSDAIFARCTYNI